MKHQIKKLKKHIHQFLKDESGQGTTEYILILVGIVGLVLLAGTFMKEDMWNSIKGKIEGVIGKVNIQ